MTTSLERSAKLASKALRDPARFLADARSRELRRLGEIATDLGLVELRDEEALRGPRGLPMGHRDPETTGGGAAVEAGRLEHVTGNRLRGYARAPGIGAALAVHVDGVEVARCLALQTRERGSPRERFDVCVDLRGGGAAPGDPVNVRVSCAHTGRELEGSPRRVRVPRYEGVYTATASGRVAGHVRDVVTFAPVHLDVLVNGRDAGRIEVAGSRGLPGFLARVVSAFALTYAPRRTDTHVAVRVRGTSESLRRERGASLSDAVGQSARVEHAVVARPVHVIVPVYGGLEVSLACVDSLLASSNATPHAITVVYDQGPDARLLAALRERARSGAFELRVNETNLGFVRTCNQAMRLRPDHDVLLLNADTEVADGFLDRLARAARSAEHVGTATPFSNAATICTYPEIVVERALPEGTDLGALDALFAAENAGQTVPLPSGHGFCLFLRRDVLDRVGLFDEDAFGRGYGEENDLCLRASAAGYTHVLACDVFVKHVGSVSFGAERSERVAHALRVIAERYPHYHEAVATFIREDAPRVHRNRVVLKELARIRAAEGPPIVQVLHHLGGGIEVHVRDLCARLAREGVPSLCVRSHADGTLRLSDADGARTAVYVDVPELARDLWALAPRLVHFHAWLTLPEEARRLPRTLGVPYDVTLHDFYATCPRVNFVRANARYCGEPSARVCETCVAVDGAHIAARDFEVKPPSVRAHREAHAGFLEGARRVVSPSNDTRTRIARVLPNVRITALGHPEVPARIRFRRAASGPVRVAVLGGIGLHKGYETIVRVAEHAHTHGLPLEIVVFGSTIDHGALRRLPNMRLTGRYALADLPALVAESGCSVALFASIWPETYSYTLSEALSLGLYPVSFDLGAPGERIRALGHGTLLSPDASAAEICDALLGAGARTPEVTVEAPFAHYPSMQRDYYDLADA